jgi:hypothetical protein
VAGYDSPGFQNQLPGFAPRSSHDYGSAPGSAPAAGDTGPVIGRPVASNPDGSWQDGAGNTPVMPVRAGATSSMSDKTPVHDGGPFLAGGRVGNAPDETGSGRGRANHHAHPNNGR